MLNDYVFPVEESGISRQQFKIHYSTTTDQYFIKDLGHESGTFVRVDSKLIIKHGYILTFGKYHVAVTRKRGREEGIIVQVIDGVQPKEK
jgi:pSer/pThr/pTyr-binding forkhead associated (FHA) protein